MQQVKYNKNIYEKSILAESVKAFYGYANIEIDEDSQYWIVRFKSDIYDCDILSNEFGNYMIDLINTGE